MIHPPLPFYFFLPVVLVVTGSGIGETGVVMTIQDTGVCWFERCSLIGILFVNHVNA